MKCICSGHNTEIFKNRVTALWVGGVSGLGRAACTARATANHIKQTGEIATDIFSDYPKSRVQAFECFYVKPSVKCTASLVQINWSDSVIVWWDISKSQSNIIQGRLHFVPPRCRAEPCPAWWGRSDRCPGKEPLRWTYSAKIRCISTLLVTHTAS